MKWQSRIKFVRSFGSFTFFLGYMTTLSNLSLRTLSHDPFPADNFLSFQKVTLSLLLLALWLAHWSHFLREDYLSDLTSGNYRNLRIFKVTWTIFYVVLSVLYECLVVSEGRSAIQYTPPYVCHKLPWNQCFQYKFDLLCNATRLCTLESILNTKDLHQPFQLLRDKRFQTREIEFTRTGVEKKDSPFPFHSFLLTCSILNTQKMVAVFYFPPPRSFPRH